MSNLPQELFIVYTEAMATQKNRQKESRQNSYTDIAIIYNPNSTGNSESNALQLAKDLAEHGFGDITRVLCTDGPGQGESIAYALAMGSQQPLIISSSGDGGYNDVINGALKAQEEGASPVCGLLPSGNANDHYRNLHHGPVIERIVSGRHRSIDVLSIRAKVDSKPWQRYAHSYIGVGLTPKVGHELNKVRLNRFVEAWIVIRTLYNLRGSRLVVRGREQTYDSLIFSNIGSMSKILTVSDSSKLTDGKFEIVAFPTKSRWQLLKQLVRASTVGLHTDRQASSYSFSTIGPTRVQLDGEIFRIDGHSQVKIELAHKELRCII